VGGKTAKRRALWSVPFIIYSYYSGIKINKNGRGDMWHIWGRGEEHAGVLLGDKVERGHLEEFEKMWEDNIKRSLQKVGWGCGVDLSGPG
jgi:hypothetical protein